MLPILSADSGLALLRKIVAIVRRLCGPPRTRLEPSARRSPALGQPLAADAGGTREQRWRACGLRAPGVTGRGRGFAGDLPRPRSRAECHNVAAVAGVEPASKTDCPWLSRMDQSAPFDKRAETSGSPLRAAIMSAVHRSSTFTGAEGELAHDRIVALDRRLQQAHRNLRLLEHLDDD